MEVLLHWSLVKAPHALWAGAPSRSRLRAVGFPGCSAWTLFRFSPQSKWQLWPFFPLLSPSSSFQGNLYPSPSTTSPKKALGPDLPQFCHLNPTKGTVVTGDVSKSHHYDLLLFADFLPAIVFPRCVGFSSTQVFSAPIEAPSLGEAQKQPALAQLEPPVQLPVSYFVAICI